MLFGKRDGIGGTLHQRGEFHAVRLSSLASEVSHPGTAAGIIGANSSPGAGVPWAAQFLNARQKVSDPDVESGTRIRMGYDPSEWYARGGGGWGWDAVRSCGFHQ